jgi:PAS domain S-box-containing protein
MVSSGDLPENSPLRQHHPLRRLLETVDTATAALTFDGIILHANARFAEMLLMSPSELQGLPLEKLAAGQPPGLCRRLLDGRQARPGSLAELILRRADRELLQVRVWLRGLESPRVIILTAFDVTPYRQLAERLQQERDDLEARVRARTAELAEANWALQHDVRRRQAAEAALRASEAKWRRLFQLTPAVVTVTTLEEGRILEANEAFLGVLGYRREEVIGRTVADLGVWGDADRHRTWVAALKRDGVVEDVEASIVTRTGEHRLALVSSGLIEMQGAQVALSVIRDITESRRAEEALRLSEEKFERVFRSSPAATALASLAEGRFLDVNDAFLRLTGYSREEVVGRTAAEIGLWRHGDQRERAVRDLLETGSIQNREYEFLRKSGQSFLGLAAAELLSAAGERVVLSLVVDITERKRMEDALAAQQRLLKAIVDQALEGITVRDAHGRLVFANPVARRMAASPPDGTPLEEAPAIWGETLDAAGRLLPVESWPIARALRGEPVQGVEWHRLRPDGTRYVVVNSAAPLRDEMGGITGAVSVTTDITGRKQAEDALAAQQRLLHAILEQAADGITVRDAEGRVCFVNMVARQRALAPPEGTSLEQAPAVWGDSFASDGTPLPVQDLAIARALRGAPARVTFFRIGPTGERRFFLSSAAPLRTDGGKSMGAVVITADITETQRVEERLRQALVDKEMLVREVHHRTKNNLQMLCDLLYLQSESLAGEEAKHAVEDSYSRIFAIARVHEQLYQSLESGRVRLGEYLRKLFDGFESLYPNVPICFDACEEPVHLDVDRAIHVGLIVNELVANAVKHAFPGGGANELVAVRLRVLEDQIELQVCDTGKGLPRDFDVKQAKTLGLRIVHVLTRRLEATLKVQGDAGARFTITFPLHADPPVGPRAG